MNWFFRPKLLVALLASVLLVYACGDSGRGNKVSTGTVGTSQSLDLSAGYAEVVPPLTARRIPLVLPMGDSVLVYGGTKFAQGKVRPFEPVGTGSIFDLKAGRWASIPDAPFAEPLRQVGGVWTGDEVIVFGTPCDAARNEDEGLVGCKPGGTQAAAYSPAKNSWRAFDTVEAPVTFDSGTGVAITSTGLGWTGSEAVFEIPNPDGGRMLVLIDPTSGKSRLVKYPDRADKVCVAGKQVLGVVTGEVVDDAGGSIAPNPEAVAQPLRTYKLQTDSLIWTQISSIGKPNSTGALFERVYCADGQMAYLPVMPSVGFGTGGMWWDATTGSWQELPSLEGAGFAGEANIAQVNDTKVIWVSGSNLYVLNPGTKRWEVRGAPATRVVGTSSVGDLVMTIGTPAESGIPDLGFLDVARYVAATAR